MKRKLFAGTTSEMIPIFVFDNSRTDGGGLGSLTSASSGLVAEYRRKGQSAWTAISLVGGTLGTFTSGGFVADGSLTGAYEIGVPDAALAAGVSWVLVRLRGATNMASVLIEIELDSINYQDSVRAGLTSLPNFAAGANGGVPVLSSSATTLAYTVSTATNLTNAPTSGDLTATMKTSVTTACSSATPTASLNLSQAVPTSNTAQTVGDALNAARAQGFGKWTWVGTTLTLYASDGTTSVRTFTLDSATSPMTRT